MFCILYRAEACRLGFLGSVPGWGRLCCLMVTAGELGLLVLFLTCCVTLASDPFSVPQFPHPIKAPCNERRDHLENELTQWQGMWHDLFSCFFQSVKKFPCRLCERSFCSAPSLRRHVRVNHEGIKRVYPCRYRTASVPSGFEG